VNNSNLHKTTKSDPQEWGLVKNNDLHYEFHYSFSEKKKQRVFIGKEIAAALGHTNVTKGIKDAGLINGKDYVIVKKAKHPDVFKQLSNLGLVGSRTSSVTILYESGVWLLTLGSRLEKGQVLRRWLAEDVLPSIREHGYYKPDGKGRAIMALVEHMDINVQKENSKAVNKAQYEKGGVEQIIEHNSRSCYEFTRKWPKQWKLEAIEEGLPSKHRTSAKAIIRLKAPEIACCMSFTDARVAEGAPFEEVADLAKQHLIPVFGYLIDKGYTPKELAA
jgi:prophage antirepressor-like protein